MHVNTCVYAICFDVQISVYFGFWSHKCSLRNIKKKDVTAMKMCYVTLLTVTTRNLNNVFCILGFHYNCIFLGHKCTLAEHTKR